MPACRPLPALLLFWWLWAAPAGAITPGELQAAGRLEISAAVTPNESIVPRQKLTLNLTIATDRWFAGGTRIELPEVPGLVVLQTEQFASNASERRGGENWVIQRWTLDLYPQRAGTFTIPPVRARVAVNAGDQGDATGTIASEPVSFTVTLPAALAEVEDWVASPMFTVEQTFDRRLEGLQVGDAFERVVVFEASDVMAMMLPSLSVEEFAGLAAYPAPPELENNNNRGASSARRTERTSYVVESEGRYRLPGRDYHWWNTARRQLELRTLPAIEITVGSAAAPVAAKPEWDWRPTPRQLLGGAAALLALAALVVLARRYLHRLPLAPVVARARALWQTLRDLRKPALPSRLNPDSSAGQ
jgi:hypothetical protein